MPLPGGGIYLGYYHGKRREEHTLMLPRNMRGRLYTEIIFSILRRMAAKSELQDVEIGELWRKYRPLEGRDDHANLILALLRKLIIQGARNIPYGDWRERLSHPLRIYGISEAEWDA